MILRNLFRNLSVDNSRPEDDTAAQLRFDVGDLVIICNVQSTDGDHGRCSDGIIKVASGPSSWHVLEGLVTIQISKVFAASGFA